jgi:hypothetical protein
MDNGYIADLVIAELRILQRQEGNEAVIAAAVDLILLGAGVLVREADLKYARGALRQCSKELAKI